MRLEADTAFVTGATQGIGKAIALRFAQEGANVVVSGRNAERGADVVRLIEEQGGSGFFVGCDVGEEDEVRRAIDATLARYGTLSILVNNAAPTDQLTSGGDNEITKIETAQWERMLRVSLTSVFWCSKYALPHIIAAGGGSVLNIATVSALRGEAGLDGYSAAKGGMVSLTRSMAVEYGKHRVRVNAIAPGYIPGDMPASKAILENPIMAKAFREAQLLPDWGEPADIAAAAAYLSSSDAKHVTGVILEVDGGSTAYSRMPDFQSEAFLEVFAAAQANQGSE